MGSRGNLIALSLICALLAVYVVLERGAPDGRARRSTRLVPEQRAAILVAIELEAGGDRARFARDPETGAFRMAEPVEAPVDDAALTDLTGTLEILSWRRRVAPGEVADAGLAPPRAQLRLTYDDGAEVDLRLGAHLPATDQYWLARGDRDALYLIDGFAGRALDRRPADLRSRRPLPTRHRDVTGIEIQSGGASLILSGRPLQVHLEGGGKARMDPDARDALLGKIDDLRLVELASAGDREPPADATSIAVIGELGTRRLIDLGPCPDSLGARLARTPIGDGCVRELALAELAVVPAFVGPLIDRHLIAADAGRPERIAIARGDERLELVADGGGYRIGDRPASADAVVEWAQELDLLGGEAMSERPADAPASATIELFYPGGRADRIELVETRRERLVARAGEPIGFPVTRTAAQLFSPDPVRFRDRSVWALDPTTLTRAARTGARSVVLERGELLEDWTAVEPADARPLAAAEIDALIEALSRLEAQRYLASSAAPVHRLASPRAVIALSFRPQVGSDAPIGHELAIGAATDAGCAARADDDPAVFELPAEVCERLLGRWTR